MNKKYARMQEIDNNHPITKENDFVFLHHMLKTAIQNLNIDTNAIINNIGTLAMTAIQLEGQRTEKDLSRLPLEIDRIKKKKEAMMDSFFAGEISGEDMQTMCKMAREEMIRYMAENQITNTASMKNFDRLNYHYEPALSSNNKFAFLIYTTNN